MISLTFNTRSWHYTIAKFGGLLGTQSDLCTYTRNFILGLLKSAFIGFIIAFAGYSLFNVLFGIGFSIYYATWMFSDEAVAAILVGLAMLLFITVFTALNRFDEYKFENDGFIKHAYDGWKNKFCVRVNIIDTVIHDSEN